jgi:hypothetical protein
VSTITRDSSDGSIALVATERHSCLHPLLAHSVAPARQRRAIEYQTVLAKLLAAEALVTGVCDPADHRAFVGEHLENWRQKNAYRRHFSAFIA